MFADRVRGRGRRRRSFRIFLTLRVNRTGQEAYFTGDLPYAAQRDELAILARLVAVFRIDSGIARSELLCKRCKGLAPFVDQGGQRWSMLFGVRLEPG